MRCVVVYAGQAVPGSYPAETSFWGSNGIGWSGLGSMYWHVFLTDPIKLCIPKVTCYRISVTRLLDKLENLKLG